MTGSGIAGLVETTTTRHLFFTGKGGVGKTSSACATAVGLAQAGGEHRYLTEVASTLAERLVVLPRVPEAPTGATRLRALVADPVPAAR